jgi:spore coat polysaccharide biosynthesis protein SpsF
MNCGILIVARLGSQRLQAKHVQPVGEVPILRFLLGRIRHAFAQHIERGEAKVVIATSDEPGNRLLEEIARGEAEVFYGAVHNIPLREKQAADHFGFTEIVSVDGDDILCSPVGMLAVARQLGAKAPYAQTSGLPFGMNSFGYTSAFLGEALGRHRDAKLETGWGRIFSGCSPAVVAYQDLPSDDRLRFTLDYAEDLAFFRAVIEALGTRVAAASDREIVELVLAKKLYALNAAVAEEYWANFRRQLKMEESASRSGAAGS